MRFRLSTLLVVVTLIAIYLGVDRAFGRSNFNDFIRALTIWVLFLSFYYWCWRINLPRIKNDGEQSKPE